MAAKDSETSKLDPSNLKSAKYEMHLDAYLELKNMINDEYNLRLGKYKEFLEK